MIWSAVALIALLILIEAVRNLPATGMQSGSFGANRGPIVRSGEQLLPPLSSDPGVFRFASFNVHRGYSADGQPSLARTVSIVESTDVLGIQEVGGGGWEGMQSHAITLARSVGDRHWLLAPSRLRWFRPRGGNAIIASPQYLDPRVTRYDVKGDRFRNLIRAEFLLNGVEVSYINTHLSHGKKNAREQQFEVAMASFLSTERGVLVADLNMQADDPMMLSFLSENNVVDALGYVAARDIRPELKPTTDVDWILVRNLEVRDAGRIPPGLSDHPMIWADIRVAPIAE